MNTAMITGSSEFRDYFEVHPLCNEVHIRLCGSHVTISELLLGIPLRYVSCTAR